MLEQNLNVSTFSVADRQIVPICCFETRSNYYVHKSKDNMGAEFRVNVFWKELAHTRSRLGKTIVVTEYLLFIYNTKTSVLSCAHVHPRVASAEIIHGCALAFEKFNLPSPRITVNGPRPEDSTKMSISMKFIFRFPIPFLIML